MSETSGTKRKSSDSAEGTDYKKLKTCAENDDSIMEKIFNNDNCIQAVLARLPVEELANVSRASSVLKINSDIVFKTVHSATIKVAYDSEHFSRQQMLFRQFGSLATEVEVDMIGDVNEEVEDTFHFHDHGNKILRTIGHFCGPNLKELTLRNMKIDLSSSDYTTNDREEVRKLLGTLTKLTLMGVCIKTPFLQWTKSLQELMIHSSCHMESLPEITVLPKLKVFKIGACPMWLFVVGRNFKRFLRVNPSIEEVDYHFIVGGDGYLASICSLPKLTHLKLTILKCDDGDLSLIATARKLKELTVHVPPGNHQQFSKLRKMLPTACKFSIEELTVVSHDDTSDDD